MHNPVYNHAHIVDIHPSKPKLLIAHNLIKMFGASMFSFFVAAFLYRDVGLSVSGILIYMSVMSAVSLAVSVWTCLYGLKRRKPSILMIVGVLFYMIYIILLYQSKMYTWAIFLAPCVVGLYTGLFWIAYPYNASLLRSTEKKFSSTYARIEIFANIGAAIGPFLGGYIAQHRGIGYAVLASAICMMLSMIPLSWYSHMTKKVHITVPTYIDYIHGLAHMTSHTKQKNIYIAYTIGGYYSVIGNAVWPLLIFLFVASFQKLGFIASLTTTMTIIGLYCVGHVTHTVKKHYLKIIALIQGGTRNFGAAMIIFGALTSVAIIGIDAMQKIVTNMNDMAVDTLLYDTIQSADSRSRILSILLRSTGILAGKTILYLLFAVLYFVIPVSALTLTIPLVICMALVVLQWRCVQRL